MNSVIKKLISTDFDLLDNFNKENQNNNDDTGHLQTRIIPRNSHSSTSSFPSVESLHTGKRQVFFKFSTKKVLLTSNICRLNPTSQ